MQRVSPLFSILAPLLLALIGSAWSPLGVLGDSENVLRMDRGAPGVNYNYDPAYDGE